MDRFIDKLKDKNLNRNKKKQVLVKVLKALIDENDDLSECIYPRLQKQLII